MTKSYIIHGGSASSDRSITGADLVGAITDNIKMLAGMAGIGNAAGHRIEAMSAQYKRSILGGKGGVELSILAGGMRLVGHDEPAPQHYTVWIYAKSADLPAPHEWDIKRPGRPALSDAGGPAPTFTLRLRDAAQRAKLDQLGGADWLRKQIDGA